MEQESPYVLAYRRRYQRSRHQQSSKLQMFYESVKTVSRQYCAESSICGLKHLVDKDTPYVERIIWVLTMFGALVCSVSLVWFTFMKYYMAPLVTTQIPEGILVSEVIFPAVGICSTNRISKTAVTELATRLLQEERNQKYNESEMLSMLYGLGQFYDLQINSDDEKFNSVQLHHILGKYEVKELMKSLTPRCEDLLLRCSWNEQTKNCSELFDFRLTMNGYCCTFNYLRQSEDFDVESSIRNIDMYNYGNKSAFDFDQGLKVLVKIDTSDDFYYNIPLQGAQLQFSDAYDFPDAPSGSFAAQIISPNVQMTVLVSASLTEASRDIQHVSVGVRECLFHDESSYLPFYTHSDCMLKCRLLFLLSNCHCTPFNMPSVHDSRVCDLRDVQCLRIYYAQSIAVRPNIDPVPPELELDLVGGGIDCPMCYPTCSKTTYNYESNNVKIFPEYSIAADPDDWLSGANFTGTSIIHVKYASETADCFGQNVIMKWFDLFSNIGSTCGFVTGFSFVSVLEFIYFFTVKLTREIRCRQQRTRRELDLPRIRGEQDPQRTRGNQDPQRIRAEQDPQRPPHTSPTALGPVTRYRPIYWNELAGSTRFGHKAQLHQ